MPFWDIEERYVGQGRSVTFCSGVLSAAVGLLLGCLTVSSHIVWLERSIPMLYKGRGSFAALYSANSL